MRLPESNFGIALLKNHTNEVHMSSPCCRGCGSTQLQLIYDFGPQPLAGEFPLEPLSKSPVAKYPLALVQCESCGLLQIKELPAIDEIFHADYRYSSSTVPSLVRHFEEYAEALSKLLPAGGRVLEFGCNDGILLAFLKNKGFQCVGVDASANVAEMARAKGLTVHSGFMSLELVHDNGLEEQFDLVTCSNVLAHIEELSATLKATRAALKPGGLFSIEVHDASKLFEETQFDTIYHEHQSYFTELTLRRTVEAAGFSFVACEKTNMHGGGLRLLCQSQPPKTPAQAYSARERVSGERFSETVARCAQDIQMAADQFGKLDAYGAAGRSQMFINMTNTANCITQVFDDSPLRQGRYIVGTDIPITSAGQIKSRACVILAWNYAPSICERIRKDYEMVITVLPTLQKW